MKALLANQAALHLTSESVPDIFSVHNAMLSIPSELKGYEQIARCKKRRPPQFPVCDRDVCGGSRPNR